MRAPARDPLPIPDSASASRKNENASSISVSTNVIQICSACPSRVAITGDSQVIFDSSPGIQIAGRISAAFGEGSPGGLHLFSDWHSPFSDWHSPLFKIPQEQHDARAFPGSVDHPAAVGFHLNCKKQRSR